MSTTFPDKLFGWWAEAADLLLDWTQQTTRLWESTVELHLRRRLLQHAAVRSALVAPAVTTLQQHLELLTQNRTQVTTDSAPIHPMNSSASFQLAIVKAKEERILSLEQQVSMLTAENQLFKLQLRQQQQLRTRSSSPPRQHHTPLRGNRSAMSPPPPPPQPQVSPAPSSTEAAAPTEGPEHQRGSLHRHRTPPLVLFPPTATTTVVGKPQGSKSATVLSHNGQQQAVKPRHIGSTTPSMPKHISTFHDPVNSSTSAVTAAGGGGAPLPAEPSPQFREGVWLQYCLDVVGDMLWCVEAEWRDFQIDQHRSTLHTWQRLMLRESDIAAKGLRDDVRIDKGTQTAPDDSEKTLDNHAAMMEVKLSALRDECGRYERLYEAAVSQQEQLKHLMVRLVRRVNVHVC